jgi:hypothetical protein
MRDQSLTATDVEIGEGPGARHETEVALTLQPFEIALVEAR